MVDTHFFLPTNKLDRLPPVYAVNEESGKIKKLPEEPQVIGPVTYSSSYHYKGSLTYFSGGAGLVSTAADYTLFLQMILNQGELDGARILGRKTIELMMSNHIQYLDTDFMVGLGFGIENDPGISGTIRTAGSLVWGGFFFTDFWVDPEERLIGILMSQIYPPGKLDLKTKFRTLVYQAIVD